jgi:hypothetical protein
MDKWTNMTFRYWTCLYKNKIACPFYILPPVITIG